MSSKTLIILSILQLITAKSCDIYASGNTPCVAAHSTTRSLYEAYNGPLYQILRLSDGTTLDISTRAGTADSQAQDKFCTLTDCYISLIYDQSEHQNHLTQAAGGSFKGPNQDGSDHLANATGASTLLNGNKVYGVYIEQGTGYRNNRAKGTATGDEPEGMYAILDGTHYNEGCCFDYGNAELDSTDTGNSHMEAIYFGNSSGYGTGAGNGPWVMADVSPPIQDDAANEQLENGLFAGAGGTNAQSQSITHRFVTAMLKGKPNTWAIRAGDAGAGTLSTFYDGPRPAGGYEKMNKEGSIILGIGGDNSNGARGTFYEGVMTSGYPTDETENAVQADIVAAGYGATSNPSPNSTTSTPNPTSTTLAVDPTSSPDTGKGITPGSDPGGEDCSDL